jgi:hypothetical protein
MPAADLAEMKATFDSMACLVARLNCQAKADRQCDGSDMSCYLTRRSQECEYEREEGEYRGTVKTKVDLIQDTIQAMIDYETNQQEAHELSGNVLSRANDSFHLAAVTETMMLRFFLTQRLPMARDGRLATAYYYTVVATYHSPGLCR